MNQGDFNPLRHPACLDLPNWYDVTAWAQHIPFAMYLVSAARPKSFVELGTYRGVSYFSFCQAVKKLNTDTKCYAVDTWLGDPQAGFLEDNVYDNLKKHNDEFYSGFSRLLKNTFDEALAEFQPQSVDLLHIDGLHTYEAVSHDFKTWLPKMSDGGIVIFHDTNVKRDDFGVWKLWEEISAQYPSFEFLHGHGLGVLAVGEKIPNELEYLFSADDAQTETVREFFHRLGAGIESAKNLESRTVEIAELHSYKRFVENSSMLSRYHIIWEKGLREYLKSHTGSSK